MRDSIARERAWVGLLARVAGRSQRRRWFRALKKASAVVDVTPQEAEIDSTALGRAVHSIPAGFDLTVWESLRASDDSRRSSHPRFSILYAGAFYGDRVEVGDLFFEGLRRFVDSESQPPVISCTYVGPHGIQFLQAAGKHECRDIAEDGGLVSPARARVMMTRADLLLLLAPPTREGGMPGGKLYEYLAAGPPILAVDGTDPYVMQMLRDTGGGEGASSPDEIAERARAPLRELAAGSCDPAATRRSRKLHLVGSRASTGESPRLLGVSREPSQRRDGSDRRGDRVSSARSLDGPPPELAFKRKVRIGLELREVWRSRGLIRTLAERDLRVRYKQAVLGFVWAILMPFVLMVVFSVFFQRIAKVDTGGAPYPLFAYLGLIPWGFFSSGVSSGGTSILSNVALLNKVYCPREVFPIAVHRGDGRRHGGVAHHARPAVHRLHGRVPSERVAVAAAARCSCWSPSRSGSRC